MNMKLFLALFLCAVTCCLAQPSCSDDDLAKCIQGINKTDILTDEEVDKYCSSISCMFTFYKDCPEKKLLDPLYKQYPKIYEALCSIDRTMREKFLKNVDCLNTVLEKVTKECQITEKDQKDFCVELPEAIGCAQKIVADTCSEDAREVFDALYPNAEYYGC